MAIDQRDHYLERLRRRTGYVERARFRMSEADYRRRRRNSRSMRLLGLVLVLVLGYLAYSQNWISHVVRVCQDLLIYIDTAQ